MAEAIFTAETSRFFRELARNNRKAWMDENRDRYRTAVVAPFRALLERLTPAVRRLNPRFEVGGRTGENFSRINRDIRFAADKSPYRSQMYLLFSEQGAEGDGQLYVGVAADAVTAGFRIYHQSRQSRLVRVAIPRAVENQQWLERQARRLSRNFESYWYASQRGEWTKHDGWPLKPDQWKRMRGWIVRKKMKSAAATRAAFPADVAKIFRRIYPLYRFCSSPSWEPDSARGL